jgi:hypothetical protein
MLPRTVAVLTLCIPPTPPSTITPDLEKHAPVYLAGFGHNRRATAIHDELYARCLALKPGKTPLVICGVDSIGLQRIRAKVKADVIVAALHDHQGPDTMGLWGATTAQSSRSAEQYSSISSFPCLCTDPEAPASSTVHNTWKKRNGLVTEEPLPA